MRRSVLAFLLLSACTLQREYRRPCLNIPNNWRLPTNCISTTANIRWWHHFDDPVLDCYIRTALINNNDIKIAVHTVREVAALWGIISSALFPEVDANAIIQQSQTSLNYTPLLPGQSRIGWDLNPYLSLSYEVDVWQRVRSASDAALMDLYASIQDRRTVVLTLTSLVASTYFLLRMYDAQVEIAQATLASRQEALRLTQIRYRAGQVSFMEVCQAQSEVEDADSKKTQLELQTTLTENALCILLGYNPTSLKRGKNLEELQRRLIVPMGLPSNLLCRRPDVQAAEDKLVAAHLRVAEAKALYYPQIFLTADYGAQSTELANLFSGGSRTWAWGLSFFEPIFNAGKTYWRIRRAKEIRYSALYSYRQTLLTAFREVNDALITENKSRELVSIERLKVAADAEYLRLATVRYDNGEVDYLTVLDAQSRFFASELALAQAEEEHIGSFVSLYKAVGGGWVISADSYMLTKPTMNERYYQESCCDDPYPPLLP